VKILYVTDRAAIGDERFVSVLESLAGAPGLRVELRERQSADRECLHWAATVRKRLGPSVPLYVNRRFDIALAAEADGAHLPADGLPLDRVRTNTPRGFRVGVSTHSAEDAIEAISGGADLVLLGPIFETPSKRSYGDPLGPETLGQLPRRDTHGCEVFAIGGIDEKRLLELAPHRDRISGIAAIRLFQESNDPRGTAERIASQ
jgi:thiamine-phosphate pyrophosphorylase